MNLSNCPKCNNPLDPAIANGYQTCKSCGWSNDPNQAAIDHNANDNSFTGALFSVENRVVLSALCHGSIFLSSLMIVPIVIPFVLFFGCESSIVKSNAREALNYQLNSLILLLVLGSSFLVSLAVSPSIAALFLFLLIIYFIANLIVALCAVIRVFNHPNETLFYPFIYRFIKA